MSTIDPDAMKKLRDGRPMTAAQLVLPGILLLFFAGMLAWSITRLAQETTRNEGDPGAMTLVWLALSALMTLTALGQWMRRAIRNPRLPGWLTALVTGEEVDVWFDRADPSNERKIVIRRRG